MPAKRGAPEKRVHKAVLDFLRQVFPSECVIHHARNEINVKGDRLENVKAASRAKEMGAVTGFPDLVVFPYAHTPVMFFEVKAPKGTVKDSQKAVHEKLRALGYRVAVVRSVDDVREALREWSIPTREVTA